MSNANTALAIHQDQPAAVAGPGSFTRDQLELLKRTVAAGTSDDEFALFAEVARTTGLNPFQRQIYAIMRQAYDPAQKKKVARMTIQTGIDGYRLIAARTGLHAGTTDAEYGPEVNGWPSWARVTVRRLLPGGGIADFTATARWDEYVQTKDEYENDRKTGKVIPSGQWPKMPYLMLGKCAEALALRKAFPAELSGVYTAEEMSQADSGAGEPEQRQSKRELAETVQQRAAREKTAAEAAEEFAARGDAADQIVPEDEVLALRATAIARGAKKKFLDHFDKYTDGPTTREVFDGLSADLDRYFPEVEREPGEDAGDE
jgi:phage recombination protein Bet